jgi:hypothetical protein
MHGSVRIEMTVVFGPPVEPLRMTQKKEIRLTRLSMKYLFSYVLDSILTTEYYRATAELC